MYQRDRTYQFFLIYRNKMSEYKFFSGIAVASAVCLMLSYNTCYASGGPQVLPSFKSDRARVKNPVPRDRVLYGQSSDPFETVNRGTWSFNYDYLDRYALRPVAHGYRDYVPKPVVTGVHNFLSNIHEVNNTVNNLAVAEFGDSAISLGRFVVNSTIGILGLFDVASHMGMEQKRMTFGTVLGKWGVNSGPYMQIPFVTMQTPRNIVGVMVDDSYMPWNHISWAWRIAYYSLSVLDSRAELIDREELIDNAVDPYISARDFYLQYLDAQVVGREGIVEAQKAKDREDQKNLEQYMDEIDD